MSDLVKYLDFGGPSAVKDIDARGRTITGYAAAFGNEDLGGDIIEPGAFRKTIRERGPKGSKRIFFLNQHDTWQVVGKPTVLKEDKYGLYHESPVPDTTLGNDVLKLFDANIMDSFSIGYRTMTEAMESGKNHLKELFLYEYSGVTFPMNENAIATGVKGLDIGKLDAKMKRMEKFCRDTDASDDTIELLLLNIKQLQQIIDTLMSSTPPVKTTAPQKEDENAAKTLIHKANTLRRVNTLKSFTNSLKTN